MTRHTPAPPPARFGGRTSALVAGIVAVIVIVGAVLIGLNLGGRVASPRPSAPATGSFPLTASATSTASATATSTPAPSAPDVAWERLDGALPAGASVYGVTNVGGRWFATGQVGRAPAIWSSDGDQPRTWTATTVNTRRAANEYAVVAQVAAIGDSLVANGWWGLADSDQFSRVAWVSADGGATWEETRTQAPALRTVMEGGPGLIGAGWASGGTPPFDSFIATSGDGISWDSIKPAAMKNSEVVDLGAIGDRLVAVGGAFANGAIHAAAWYSDDQGSTWTAADTGGAAGMLNEVTQLGQGLVAVGGTEVPTAWTSDDGLTWTAHPIAQAGVATAVAPMERGGIVVVGNDGPRDTGPELAWSSLDGIAWVAGAELPPARSRMLAATAYGSAVVAGGACVGGETCPTPLWLGLPRE